MGLRASSDFRRVWKGRKWFESIVWRASDPWQTRFPNPTNPDLHFFVAFLNVIKRGDAAAERAAFGAHACLRRYAAVQSAVLPLPASNVI